MRSAILAAPEGVQRSEPTSPRQALAAAGSTSRLVAPLPWRVQAYDHLGRGDTVTIDRGSRHAVPHNRSGPAPGSRGAGPPPRR